MRRSPESVGHDMELAKVQKAHIVDELEDRCLASTMCGKTYMAVNGINVGCANR